MSSELQPAFRWWPVPNHPPPTDWVKLFNYFQSPQVAGHLGPRAARYIMRVRAKTGQGPTFSELFAELGVVTANLSEPPDDIPRGLRTSLRGRLLLSLALALHGRGWIRWSEETRSLDVGPRFDPNRRPRPRAPR